MFVPLTQTRPELAADPLTAELLAAAFDTLDVAVALTDPAGRILRANNAFDQLVGPRSEEFSAARAALDDLFVGVLRPPSITALVASGQGWCGEARIRSNASRGCPVQLRLAPQTDAQGHTIGLVAVLTDLTRQKQQEADRRMFEMALEQCLEPVLITEAEPISLPGPRIVYANRAFTQATGYSLDEVRGLSPRLLQGSATDRATLDRIRRALERWEPIKVELLNYRKDGTEFWVELAICPVADETGWFTHWVSVQRDVTERKQFEEQQERAREAAERASEAKSRFLANISHEIRTPLTAILGYSEMLLNARDASPEGIETLQAIHRNGRHLLQLVGSVLDLSKIEAGKVEPRWVAGSPWSLAHEVAASQRLLAAGRGVQLSVHAVGPLPTACRIEPTLTQQVLLNLVGNALKFTDPGGSVTIEIEAVGRDGEHADDRIELRFSVEDNGIGIDEQQAKRLFEAFEQGDNSTTRRHGGTGLGLSIARQLVELMGGTIELRSRSGAGSRFTVCLPSQTMAPVAAQAAAQAGGSHDPQPARPQGSGSRFARPAAPRLSGRVLLVDDNPDNRRILQYHLRPTGLDIELAEDGSQAIEHGLAGRFDIILLDMHMPVVDGYTAARSLREQGFQGPIIALTGHALAEDRQRCLQAGCTDYLAKPILVGPFYDLLSRYLRAEVLPPGSEPVSAAALRSTSQR